PYPLPRWGRGRRLPLESRLHGLATPPSHPAIGAHDGEEDSERAPHLEPHAQEGAAGEDARDAVEHAQVLARPEKDLDEGGLVPATDEAHEGADAAPGPPRIALEAPGLEAAVGEGGEDLRGCHLRRLHGHVDARGEDGIDEGER